MGIQFIFALWGATEFLSWWGYMVPPFREKQNKVKRAPYIEVTPVK